MENIQRLLDATFPFIKDLLQQYGEFYPLAATVKLDGTISQVGAFDGDDFPDSNDVIVGLKKGLVAHRHDYQAIALFYDVRTTDPNTQEKTDAVAVFVEQNDWDAAYTFYYPYRLIDKQPPIFSNPWKNSATQEIFNQ